jgi:lipid A 3-O-deacylase
MWKEFAMNKQVRRDTRQRSLLAASFIAAACVAVSLESHAEDSIDAANGTDFYMRLDNDVFAGTDRGYSNGTEFGFVSPTVADFQDERLSAATRWLNRRLAWLQPQGYSHNNVVLTLGQGMYTPSNWRLENPDPNDRPYAGVLVAGVTYNGRDRDSMRATTLNVGIVGPSAFAEETQSFVHHIVGGRRFAGWDHQLRDEPVFRLLQQRMHKRTWIGSTVMSDVILHYGGSIGNLTTFVNAGAEIRFGSWFPDNFGSAPLLPVYENTAPSIGPVFSERVRFHGFVALDVRYVIRDITLDGNTFKDSPSVDRKDLVADLGIGIAAHWGNWKIAFARYFRTREFRGQDANAELGSITIRRAI